VYILAVEVLAFVLFRLLALPFEPARETRLHGPRRAD
jgi:hypothetical protein